MLLLNLLVTPYRIIAATQEVGAGDLTTILTLEKVTIPGVLLAMVLYMGWRLHNAEKKLEQAKQEHMTDLKAHKEDYQKDSERFFNAMEQLKQLVR